MAESNGNEQVLTKADQWRERIAEQERSGMSVRRFCKERGLAEHSFYVWRKRLAGTGTGAIRADGNRAARPDSPERRLWNCYWRLASGCESAPGWTPTRLRTVLDALRA